MSVNSKCFAHGPSAGLVYIQSKEFSAYNMYASQVPAEGSIEHICCMAFESLLPRCSTGNNLSLSHQHELLMTTRDSETLAALEGSFKVGT